MPSSIRIEQLNEADNLLLVLLNMIAKLLIAFVNTNPPK